MKEIEVIGPPDCPLMFRRTLISNRFFKVLLHEFLPGASDKDYHDHPRGFLTFVYRGGYDDVSPCECGGAGAVIYTDDEGLDRVRLCARGCDGEIVDRVRAPAFRRRRATHQHITRVHGDGAKSLVVMGPLRRVWGFWNEGRWYEWRTYERIFGLGWRCPE